MTFYVTGVIIHDVMMYSWVIFVKNDINCMILCAGQGSRMNDETKNKVCFEVAGKPAVVRVVENLKKCGVSKFVVVVGNKSESVMKALKDVEGVMYAFQPVQLGTGNAVMCGLRLLNNFGIDGPVLTVMGDKLIDKSVFQKLIDDFYENKSDISFIVQPAALNPSGGKVAMSNGKVAGIVEHMDLLLLKVCELMRSGMSAEDAFSAIELTKKQSDKITAALASLGQAAKDHYVEINGEVFTSDEIISSGVVNCATYLHKRSVLDEIVCNLSADNAQNEIYFTDTISEVSKNGVVSCVEVDERELIHTFNTVEELNAINDFFKGVNIDE